MRKRRLRFLGAGLLVTIALGGYVLVYLREPAYKGRPLNEWIRAYADGKAEFTKSEIDEAVRTMGTDAIPFLVKWMKYEPASQSTGKLAVAWSALTRRANPSWEREQTWFAFSSTIGFRALGPAGAAGIGPLSKLLVGPGESAGWRAGNVLVGIGKAAVPSILSAMTNESAMVRKRAVKCCSGLGSNAWLAVPELIQLRSDRVEGVRDEASWVLLLIRRRPETLLPGILANLENPERWMRWAAMVSLTELPEFESNAQAGLQNPLVNVDRGIREDATNALRRRMELPRWSLPPPKPAT